MKKILYIINNDFVKSIDYLSNNYKSVEYIHNSDLSKHKIYELVLKYDIIFIGGGPQHLTIDKINNFNELNDLLLVVRFCDFYNKILIGICLGAQIISHYYGLKIKKLNQRIISNEKFNFDYMNFDLISNDYFLSKIDFELLSSSFRCHYDYIEYEPNIYLELVFTTGLIPYVLKHKSKYIYCFQSHPEIEQASIYKCLEKFNANIYIKEINKDIQKNFFDAFCL